MDPSRRSYVQVPVEEGDLNSNIQQIFSFIQLVWRKVDLLSLLPSGLKGSENQATILLFCQLKIQSYYWKINILISKTLVQWRIEPAEIIDKLISQYIKSSVINNTFANPNQLMNESNW